MLHPSATGTLQSLLSSTLLHPLNDLDAIDDLLGLVDPAWSLTRVRARVVGAVRETPRARTLVLAPNRLWRGHRAGQHVGVEVEVDGRRLHRVFSLSSPPRRDGTLRITVQKHDRGKVSAWWNDRARPGDVVTLTQASGGFVLPTPLPSRLVMVAGGSSMTPLMAMLEELHASGAAVDVTLVAISRSRQDTLFLDRLEELARDWPRLELCLHASGVEGRPGRGFFEELAERSRGATTLACGPAGLLEALRLAWKSAGTGRDLHVERFGAARREAAGHDGSHRVVATRDGRAFEAREGRSLLEEAEAAGLAPLHGCRSGICHLCKCRKLRGVVEDLRDGSLHDEDGESIQLCVSAARSALELDL